MADQHDFFTPEDVEKQIDRVDALHVPIDNARLFRDLRRALPYWPVSVVLTVGYNVRYK